MDMGNQSSTGGRYLEENVESWEEIRSRGELLAIILRKDFNREGCSFLTPADQPLQLGIHIRERRTEIKPHVHRSFSNLENLPSHEVFFVLEGRVQVDIFKGRTKVCYRVLERGDVALLMSGHSVKFLEKSKMIELKQGPYRGVENEKEFL